MTDKILLRLPAKAGYVLPVRLMISGVATRMHYPVEGIEDMKTAVSEACVMLLNGVCDGEVELVMEVGESLDVSLQLTDWQGGGEEISPETLEFSQMIVEACTQEQHFLREEDKVVAVQMRFER